MLLFIISRKSFVSLNLYLHRKPSVQKLTQFTFFHQKEITLLGVLSFRFLRKKKYKRALLAKQKPIKLLKINYKNLIKKHNYHFAIHIFSFQFFGLRFSFVKVFTCLKSERGNKRNMQLVVKEAYVQSQKQIIENEFENENRMETKLTNGRNLLFELDTEGQSYILWHLRRPHVRSDRMSSIPT